MTCNLSMRGRSARGVKAWFGHIAKGICIAALGMTAVVPHASYAASGPIIIRNDTGGFIKKRAREIAEIERRGQRVEIRGAVCYSSCTMYLVLATTCITPTTVFGFHAPVNMGRKFTKHEFDQWTDVLSQYYPRPVRAWYMREARYVRGGVKRIQGAQLIRMGVPQC